MYRITVTLTLFALLLANTTIFAWDFFSQQEEQEEISKVEVVIANGAVIGQNIPVVHRNVSQFLGIPYAKPPVGKLRFRRPVPITEKWTTPVDATHWPNQCVQRLVDPSVKKFDYMFKNDQTSEDCLYLNVWSPNVYEEENQLRPVLVWIHGGALISGTSSFAMYNGETLASVANAVVVTINYRLSILGFLYSDEVSDIKGNQALWDQALALEWIQENIRYFGGNPDRVTIFGTGTGSWLVSLHVLSPVSRRLYHNAIIMSGAAKGGYAIADTYIYTQFLLRGIRNVGCATPQQTTITQTVIDCLERLNADKIDDIHYLAELDHHGLPQLVIADGDFLPASPDKMLQQGNFKTDINLLVGTVEDEGSFLLGKYPQLRVQNAEPLTLQEAKNILVDYVSRNLAYINKTVDSDALTKLYFAGLNELYDHQDLYRKQIAIGVGDYVITCPTLAFAQAIKRYAPNTATVYQWYYTAKLGNITKLGCPQWSGTCHHHTFYPIFGLPFRFPFDYHPRERDISNEVIGFIGGFIRLNKPGPEHPKWEPYFFVNNTNNANASPQRLVAPYYQITNNPRSSADFKFNLKQLECEVLYGNDDDDMVDV